MKIIYEDSNGRDENRPTENGSDGFSRSNIPPEVKSVRSSRKPRKETQHISSGVPETKNAEDEPRQTDPTAQQAQPMPEFKLTQEQIAILLQQYLNANPNAANTAANAQPAPQSTALSAEPKKPDEPSKRAGTRIVFQSPDFDMPDEGLPKYGGPVIPDEFDYDYDEDDELDEDYDLPEPKALLKGGDIDPALTKST